MTDFRMTRGDSPTFNVTMERLNVDTGLDEAVTAAKAWFTIKSDIRQTMEEALVALNSEDDPTQVVLSAGAIRIELNSADTSDIDSEQEFLFYDVQIIEASGKVSTIEKGYLHIDQDITNTIV